MCAYAKEKFIEAMDDDFNTSKALGEIFNLVTKLNSAIGDQTIGKNSQEIIVKGKETILELVGVFGLDINKLDNNSICDQEDSLYPDEILALSHNLTSFDGDNKNDAANALIEARAQARADKN